ncbi:MAG TPA: hypothetical protein VD932_03500, partial [Aquabacterium sp.]|nr:hypothetical protein [Aquabacterium sp.]
MAATLTLRRGGSAPFAQRYSAAGAAGSGWSGAALSLLVAAWDGDEADLDNLRALNWYRSGYGINDVESYATESALSNQTPTTTNTVTLSWSGPRRQPHHYSAYRMAGAAFLSDGTGLAQKILPSGAGEIAGNLLTASFASGAAVTERRLVPVLLVDGTTGAIDIPGNRTHSFLAGTSQVTLTSVPGWADGAKTVSAVTLTHTVNGEVTRLTLTGWGGGVTSSGGTCQYDLGPLCLNTSLWRPSLTFSLEYDLALSPRTQTGRDFNGRMVRLSQLTASPYERLGIELAYGGITAAHL